MWPDRVSNPGPLTYKSGALPTMLRGPEREREREREREKFNILVSLYENHVESHVPAD